jgi:hypothetical protein
LIQSRVFTYVFTRYTQRRKTKFRREYVYGFLFSLSVEFLNHVNKFRVQYLTIYLPRVLCLSYSCHIPVVLSVVVAER